MAEQQKVFEGRVMDNLKMEFKSLLDERLK